MFKKGKKRDQQKKWKREQETQREIIKEQTKNRIKKELTELFQTTLLISIGKLKPTIDMITYRNNYALDSKDKTAFKSFYILIKGSSNSNYFGY